MKAVPPSDAHLTQSQWVIALKERGHLPARCDRYEYYNVEISEEEYEKVLERATLGGSNR